MEAFGAFDGSSNLPRATTVIKFQLYYGASLGEVMQVWTTSSAFFKGDLEILAGYGAKW